MLPTFVSRSDAITWYLDQNNPCDFTTAYVAGWLSQQGLKPRHIKSDLNLRVGAAKMSLLLRVGRRLDKVLIEYAIRSERITFSHVRELVNFPENEAVVKQASIRERLESLNLTGKSTRRLLKESKGYQHPQGRENASDNSKPSWQIKYIEEMSEETGYLIKDMTWSQELGNGDIHIKINSIDELESLREAMRLSKKL